MSVMEHSIRHFETEEDEKRETEDEKKRMKETAHACFVYGISFMLDLRLPISQPVGSEYDRQAHDSSHASSSLAELLLVPTLSRYSTR